MMLNITMPLCTFTPFPSRKPLCTQDIKYAHTLLTALTDRHESMCITARYVLYLGRENNLLRMFLNIRHTFLNIRPIVSAYAFYLIIVRFYEAL